MCSLFVCCFTWLLKIIRAGTRSGSSPDLLHPLSLFRLRSVRAANIPFETNHPTTKHSVSDQQISCSDRQSFRFRPSGAAGTSSGLRGLRRSCADRLKTCGPYYPLHRFQGFFILAGNETGDPSPVNGRVSGIS